MVVCIKTTLNLPDPLLQAVKLRAAEEGRTQTSLIEEALRRMLSETPRTAHRPMPTFGVPGVNPLLIDLDDKAPLNEVLYATEDRRFIAGRDEGKTAA